MLYGWRLLEADITRAAIGKSKDNAVRAICLAYREFVAKHKGVFEAMQEPITPKHLWPAA